MCKIYRCNQRNERQNTIKGTCFDPLAKSDVPEKLQQLLDIIYSVNPKLGYPQGDLAIWLSDNAHPEIRDFIQKNLIRQTDTEPSAVSMSTDLQNSLRSAITDDDIANFYRRKGETRSEYSERMYGYLQNMKIRESVKRDMKKIIKETKEKLNEG